MVKINVDSVLTSQGLPSIDSAQFADTVAQKLKAYAPKLMQGTVKPYVQDLVDRAPELRGQAVDYLRANAQPMANTALDQLEAQYLPQLDSYIQSFVSETAEELMDQVDEDFQGVVADLVASFEDAASELENQEAVELALADAIEQGMGEHLDEMLEGLDVKVAKLRGDLEGIVDRLNEGRLTERDKLEILLIQDVRMLFESREFDRHMQQSGVLDDLREALQALQLPGTTTEELVNQVRAGRPFDLENVDEIAREEARKAMEAAQARAAQAEQEAAAAQQQAAQRGPDSPAPAPAPARGPRGGRAGGPPRGARAGGPPTGARGPGGPPSDEEIAKMREEAIARAQAEIKKLEEAKEEE
jgi:hypothetical protein